MCNHRAHSMIILAISILIILFVPHSVFAQKKDIKSSEKSLLIVGIDADYAPLEYVDEKGIPHGYDVEFTNILMERLGFKFTYAPNTWENIAGDVLHGRVDLGMMIYSPYRKDSTNYSRAVFRLYYQVVYQKKEMDNFNFRDLKGKHIAFMKSRPVGIMLENEKAIGHQVTNLSQAFEDLANDRYDAIICFRYQARYFISHFNYTSLTTEDLSLQPREYCYVSHSRPLIEAINKELKIMEEEGIIDEVYGKEIKAQFGGLVIPEWVWYMLASIIFVFLLVLVIGYRISINRLAAEHQKLIDSNLLLEENNNALIKANERAEESSRMKTAFIQQISHEIRTPLNVLNGFTQVLTTSGLELSEEEKADIGHRIEDNTVRITGLVNKMLELSEASSQTVIECKNDVNAEEIALQAICDSGIQTASHITFEFQMAPSVSSIVLRTNLEQAARALTLLLDNAKKFVEKGETRLIVEEYENSMIAFIVEDNGIGVPPEKAEHIFEPFVQLDDYYDGTGIGLTVSRSIARRMGGNVVLDTSYASNGARFVLTLPIVKAQN